MATRAASELVGGTHYPRDVAEFNRFFPDEEACRIYLEALRWPDGFICPACEAEGSPWRMQRGLLLCTSCRAQVSLTAGTIFQGTRKPLRLWFDAIWYITGQKHGVSALGLQRVLGLRSYQTAWTWAHKLRRAMVRPGRDKLSGLVEVDETYVGGEETGVVGRKTHRKALVAIAAELKGRRIGRIRLQQVKDVSEDSLIPFVRSTIMPESTVRTDGWSGYNALGESEYHHDIVVIAKSKGPAHDVLPHVHRVASLLKRWLIGTFQGAVSSAHLDYYLDEFTFRFNRRASRHRGLLFYRLLSQATDLEPITTTQLYRNAGRGRRSTT